MSIKNKFESIKMEVEAKKTESELIQGKEAINGLGDEKRILSDKISLVSGILSKLENIFSKSKKSLIDFKAQKEEINNLFNEYKDYLVEKDITSIKDLLNNPEFAEEEEIKKYNKTTPQQDAAGNRGELGDNIESAIKIKQEAKESLSDLNLDFRGGLKEGEEISPRQESLIKIQNYLEKLKGDLEVLNNQEKGLKTEHLPKVKELVTENIEKIFSNKNLSIGPTAENLNIIRDEVFKLSGDEFWPEVKKIAIEMFDKKYQERFGNKFSNINIEKSLEMEKLIFEAKEIREKHQDLLILDNDNEWFNFLRNGRFFDGCVVGETMLIKDGKAYLGSILSGIEYFTEKNVEAKIICEETIEDMKKKISELEEKIPSGFLAGKSSREDIESFTMNFKEIKEALNNIKAPDSFYSEYRYAFLNNFSKMANFGINIKSDKDWAYNLNKELGKIKNDAYRKLNDLLNKEESLGTLSNNIYDSLQYSSSKNDFEQMNGFRAVYKNIKKTSAYEYSFNKKDFDDFLDNLSGKKISKEELEMEVKKRQEIFKKKIEDYPNSKEILEKFHGLLEEYEKKFSHESQNEILQKKNYYRNNDNPGYFEAIDPYKFKSNLFYGLERN